MFEYRSAFSAFTSSHFITGSPCWTRVSQYDVSEIKIFDSLDIDVDYCSFPSFVFLFRQEDDERDFFFSFSLLI